MFSEKALPLSQQPILIFAGCVGIGVACVFLFICSRLIYEISDIELCCLCKRLADHVHKTLKTNEKSFDEIHEPYQNKLL